MSPESTAPPDSAAGSAPEPPADPPIRATLWRLGGHLLFRCTPHTAYRWRRAVLRAFGARIAGRAKFRRSVRIDRPWHLKTGNLAIFGDEAILRARSPIEVGERCVISQYAILSTEVRDHARRGAMDQASPGRAGGAGRFPVRTAPIRIEDDCWIATDALVLPGATVRQGTVVGARALVEGELPPWRIATGEPASPRGERRLYGDEESG